MHQQATETQCWWGEERKVKRQNSDIINWSFHTGWKASAQYCGDGTLSFSPPSHLSNALTGKCIAENPGVGLQGSADWVQHVFNYIHIILLITMFCCGHPLSSMWSKLPNPIVHSKINRFFPLMVHPVCQTETSESRSLTYVSCRLMWCAQTAFSGGIAPNSETASCVHCTLIILVHRSANIPTLHQWESLSQIFSSGKESWFCTRKNLKEV